LNTTILAMNDFPQRAAMPPFKSTRGSNTYSKTIIWQCLLQIFI
jgi:hypothetical protein